MRSGQDRLLLSLLVAGDLLALVLSFRVASSLRVALNALLPRSFTAVLAGELFPPVELVAPLWVLTFALVGSYQILGRKKVRSLVGETAKAASVAMGLQIIVLFFLTRRSYSRSLFLLFWAVSLALVLATRFGVLRLARRLKQQGLAGEAVAVVGTDVMARLVRTKLASRTEARYRFVGFLSDSCSTVEEVDELGSAVLGPLDKAEAVLNEHSVSRLIVADPRAEREALVPLALICARLGIALERVPDLLGLMSARPEISDLDGLPLMALRAPRFTRKDEIVKRVVDLALGSLIAAASAPLALAIAAASKLDSPGPVLYVQRRMGKGGSHFDVYKFRSMFLDAEERRRKLDVENEAGGHLFKIRGDPRITRVGVFLRRFSLDELPQIINVLKGEMSLVGPRPLPIEDLPVDPQLTPHSLWLERRRAVAPGVTGLWQVSGRSDLPFEEMVRLDLFYVENWSLALDLQILSKTLPVILRGKGAY